MVAPQIQKKMNINFVYFRLQSTAFLPRSSIGITSFLFPSRFKWLKKPRVVIHHPKTLFFNPDFCRFSTNDPKMASTSAQKASSSPSTPHSYEVFISFRGEDTRKNFTDHLYTTLVAYGVHTFRDDKELEKGGDIASDLLRAIEESKIFITIFSTNYANSSWCLNELVKIFECTTQKQSTILPICQKSI